MAYALITGAGKGIGLAIAKELARKKINVLLIARDTDVLQKNAIEIMQQFKVETDFLSIDLSRPTAATEVFDWLNRKNFKVNILVNNAGYGLSGSFEKYTSQEHTEMIQVNTVFPVQICSLLMPMLKEQPKSYILNIASTAAYQAVPGLSVYAASKAFMMIFSRGLKYELKNSNVSVTVVNPGSTDTGFAERAKVDSPKAKKLAKQFNMTPEDVATQAVAGMFAEKAEVIIGFINKLTTFFVWLMPKKVSESSAAGIYDL